MAVVLGGMGLAAGLIMAGVAMLTPGAAGPAAGLLQNAGLLGIGLTIMSGVVFAVALAHFRGYGWARQGALIAAVLALALVIIAVLLARTIG